jgi:hypothetical protein
VQLEVFNTHVGQLSAYSLETRVGLLVYLRIDGFDPLAIYTHYGLDAKEYRQADLEDTRERTILSSDINPDILHL